MLEVIDGAIMAYRDSLLHRISDLLISTYVLAFFIGLCLNTFRNWDKAPGPFALIAMLWRGEINRREAR